MVVAISKEERKLERRRQILDAALRAFADGGFHQTHVSDVIREAKIARGTFYLYFDGKTGVFSELVDGLLLELRGTIRGIRLGAEHPPVEEQLCSMLRGLFTKVVENRQLTRIVVHEAVGADPEVDRRMQRFYSNLLAYVRKALERGKSMKMIRPINSEIAAMCIVGGIKQFMEQLVWRDAEKVDVDEIARAVLDYNLRGLLASDLS